MPDASTLDLYIVPQATSVTSISGGVNLARQHDILFNDDVVIKPSKTRQNGIAINRIEEVMLI